MHPLSLLNCIHEIVNDAKNSLTKIEDELTTLAHQAKQEILKNPLKQPSGSKGTIRRMRIASRPHQKLPTKTTSSRPSRLQRLNMLIKKGASHRSSTAPQTDQTALTSQCKAKLKALNTIFNNAPTPGYEECIAYDSDLFDFESLAFRKSAFSTMREWIEKTTRFLSTIRIQEVEADEELAEAVAHVALPKIEIIMKYVLDEAGNCYHGIHALRHEQNQPESVDERIAALKAHIPFLIQLAEISSLFSKIKLLPEDSCLVSSVGQFDNSQMAIEGVNFLAQEYKKIDLSLLKTTLKAAEKVSAKGAIQPGGAFSMFSPTSTTSTDLDEVGTKVEEIEISPLTHKNGGFFSTRRTSSPTDSLDDISATTVTDEKHTKPIETLEEGTQTTFNPLLHSSG